jgi:threonine/homoserine/homoserine lactone efflux protein
MGDTSIFMKGLLVGFSIAAPVGVIGTLCIRHALNGGFVQGLAAGLGAATADALYGLIAGSGLSLVHTLLLHLQTPLSVLGGLFLLYLGVITFFSTPPSDKSRECPHSPVKVYFSTFFLTLTNPMTILAFTALLTGLRIDTTHVSSILLFVVGVFIGSGAWWVLLSGGVSLFRTKVTTQALGYINKLSGLIIGFFGLQSLLKVLSYSTILQK